jgi:hypothetical protein
MTQLTELRTTKKRKRVNLRRRKRPTKRKIKRSLVSFNLNSSGRKLKISCY